MIIISKVAPLVDGYVIVKLPDALVMYVEVSIAAAAAFVGQIEKWLVLKTPAKTTTVLVCPKTVLIE